MVSVLRYVTSYFTLICKWLILVPVTDHPDCRVQPLGNRLDLVIINSDTAASVWMKPASWYRPALYRVFSVGWQHYLVNHYMEILLCWRTGMYCSRILHLLRSQIGKNQCIVQLTHRSSTLHRWRIQAFLSNGCIGCIYLVKILAHCAPTVQCCNLNCRFKPPQVALTTTASPTITIKLGAIKYFLLIIQKYL